MGTKGGEDRNLARGRWEIRERKMGTKGGEDEN